MLVDPAGDNNRCLGILTMRVTFSIQYCDSYVRENRRFYILCYAHARNIQHHCEHIHQYNAYTYLRSCMFNYKQIRVGLQRIYIYICVCVCVCTLYIQFTTSHSYIYIYIYINKYEVVNCIYNVHTHTHTHTHIYIYLCVCVCVCVCTLY